MYEDKTRNVLAPQRLPGGDGIIFSVGEFTAFFDGFHRLFLKSADRVDGEAQIAIVKSDGTGCEELTMGGNNNAFPSFAPNGNRFVFRAFQKDGCGLRIMNLDTKAVTTLTSEYHVFVSGRRSVRDLHEAQSR